MKQTIFIFIILIALFSCNKTNEPQIAFNLDINFEFSVYNAQNEDLFDTLTINHYDSKNVKLFYVIGGQLQEVFNANMDYPRNYLIYQGESENIIRVFLNNTETEFKPITIIQWNTTDLDTVEAIFERCEMGVLKKTVWLNGKEIWSKYSNENEWYKIMK